MKFGKYLLEKQRPEWASKYIDYAKLKGLIKESVGELENPTSALGSPRVASLSVVRPRGGADAAEERFYRSLDAEVDKIGKQTASVVGVLRSRLAKLQERANALAASQPGAGSGPADGAGEGAAAAAPGSASASDAGLTARQAQDERAALLAEGKRIGDEILALEKYVNLNYMGFHKILKKHDKALPSTPCRQFYISHLHQQPWVQGNYSDMMVLLSNAFSTLRGDTLAEAKGGTAQAFNRSTTKYWIRTGDVSAVKRIIIENMPVFVFNAENYTGDAQLVNSAYFDNDSLELYHGRLDKKPGAIALRVRWYGPGTPKLCFIERKVHRESWKGELSVKERFTLPERLVVPFLEGDYTVDDYADSLRQRGKSEEDISKACDLFSELQRTVDAKQLAPLVRTQYMRSAFQMGHDRRVSFTLDTNLVMLKENPEGHPSCQAMRRWYRDPSLPVHRTEITRFPHAVLEIKLALPEGEAPPLWVRELSESDLVTEVHKMSKFIHGGAVLFPDLVQAVPYWLDDESLRASILASAPEPGAPAPGRRALTDGAGDDADGAGAANGHGASDANGVLAASKPRARGVGQAGGPSSSPGQAGALTSSSSHPLLGDAPPLRLMGARERAQGAAAAAGSAVTSAGGTLVGWLRRLGLGHQRGVMVNSIPQRLEPKTFLASERTFLSWLHMAITLASIAAALLAFAGSSSAKRDPLHKAGGNLVVFVALTLLPLSIIICAYATVAFAWRSKQIALKAASYIDDRRGPYLLVVLVIAALGAIFVAALVDFVDAWKGDKTPKGLRMVSGAFQIAGQMSQPGVSY